MSLQDEISLRASQIYRESYQMSIGELINLYKDGELDIHPEFQRVFRWSDYQKTKLIESIMLNIPTTPGVRSIPRFKDLSQFGVEYFKP